MALHAGVTTGVPTLWQEQLFTDFTIEVEHHEFKVHKVILASVCDYFKAMLTGSTEESQTDRVRIEGLSANTVNNMIKFIYTGQLDTDTLGSEDLACAVYFQFPSAIKKCSRSLYKRMTHANCFELLTVFKAHSMEFYVEQTKNYIKSIIDYLVNDQNSLPYDAFLVLMDIWGKSEWELFDSANMWVTADFENRVQHLNDLMSHIKFTLMTPEQLESVQKSHIFSTFEGSWCSLVNDAIKFHALPIHQKVMYNPEQDMPRVEPSPVCFSADSVGEFYVGKAAYARRSWDKHETLQPPKMGEPAAVLQVNNYLIVCDNVQCGAPGNKQNWFLFDPCTRKWDTMAYMVTPRDAFALVHYSRHLYSLGGLVRETPAGILWPYSVDDSIERYDFDGNTWSTISIKLPVALQSHGACVIGDSIYVTGGFTKPTVGEREWHSSQLHCFNPITEIWVKKSAMVKWVFCCKVLAMNLWDEEVIFVISEDFTMQYYTPTTDQWSVYECSKYVTTGLRWNPKGTVLGKGNMFYFLMFDQNRPEVHKPQVQYKRREVKTSAQRSEILREVKEDSVKEPFFLSVTWTIEDQGREITEELLQICPVKEKPFCAILSLIPEPTQAE